MVDIGNKVLIAGQLRVYVATCPLRVKQAGIALYKNTCFNAGSIIAKKIPEQTYGAG